MKKMFILLLIAVTCLSLVACNGESEKNKNAVSNPEIGTPVEMDEQVIYDENDIVIKAKRLEFEEQLHDYCAYYYYEVTNNSETDIILTHLTFDVNGLSLHTPYGNEVVQKGKTIENKITLNRNCCEWNDIRVIQDISFNIKIEACHKKSSDSLYSENPDNPLNYETDGVIVERTGDLIARTKYADKFADYEQKVDTDGSALFENENIALIFNEVFTEYDSYGGKNLKAYLYLKNNYDFPIKVNYTAKKINGEEIPNENNEIEIPFKSEGFRYWWESDIDYEEIESMDFIYTVSNADTNEVLWKSESLVTLNFGK